MPKRRRDKDGLFSRDGWFYLQHKGRRISLKTENRDEARARAAEHKRRESDPSHAAAHVKTLREACADFHTYAKTGENRRRPPSDATFEMYRTHYGNLCRVLGFDTVMENIDAAAVDDYIATRRAEHVGTKVPPPGQPDPRRLVSANTVDKELGTLRQILRLGLRRGWYHLPLDRVLPESSGAEYVPLDRHLTLEQVPKLLHELAHPVRKSPTWLADDPEGRAAYCAYIVAFGADVVAAERAERFDLGTADYANLLVLIRGTKNAKRWAEVPLVYPFQPFAELAREYLVKHGRFPKWGKQRCRDLNVACKNAGLPRITPRDLRRTHGKILAALGVSPHLIGGMLRHSDSRMAERVYARPEREEVRQQVSAATRRAG